MSALFIILVSLTMTRFSEKCLFPLDEYMVLCPTWAKEFGRTLLKLSPNCSPGTFHPNFIQILHQTCIVCKVENGYCIMKLDPRIIHVLQLWYLNFYWKIIQAWYNPVSVDFWCYIYKILNVITITNGTSKKSSFNSEYFY